MIPRSGNESGVIAHNTDREKASRAAAAGVSSRYQDYVPLLQAYLLARPSAMRFHCVCHVFKDFLDTARRDPVDRKIDQQPWFGACVGLLVENPHSGIKDNDAYFRYRESEVKLMQEAFKVLARALRKWADKVAPENLDLRFDRNLYANIINLFAPTNRAMWDEPPEGNEDEFLEGLFSEVECTDFYEYNSEKNPLAELQSADAHGYEGLRIPKEQLTESAAYDLEVCEAYYDPVALDSAPDPVKANAFRYQHPETPKHFKVNVVESPMGTACRLLAEYLQEMEAETAKANIRTLLAKMSEVVRQCHAIDATCLFALPCFIKALVILRNQGGTGKEESVYAEAADTQWGILCDTLAAYYSFFCEKASVFEGLPDLIGWLSQNRILACSVNPSENLPFAHEYYAVLKNPVEGLWASCRTVALICYPVDFDCLRMYAGIFPERLLQELNPNIPEEHIRAEVYRKIEAQEAAILSSSDAPMIKFKAVCKALEEGLYVANQNRDCDLPEHKWFLIGFRYALQNPRGEAGPENWSLNFYASQEAAWVENCWMPVLVALKLWAKTIADYYPFVYKHDTLLCAMLTDLQANSTMQGPNETILLRQLLFEQQSNGSLIYRPAVLIKWANLMPKLNVKAVLDVRAVTTTSEIKDEMPGASPVAWPLEKTIGPREKAAASEGGKSTPSEGKEPRWEDFYGRRIHWFRVSSDGRWIIDLSEQDPKSKCGYAMYGEVSATANNARKMLAFFFDKYERCFDENDPETADDLYDRPSDFAKLKQSARQLKEGQANVRPMGDFLALFEKKNGKWRLPTVVTEDHEWLQKEGTENWRIAESL